MTQVENSTSVISYGYDKEDNSLLVLYHKSGLYKYPNITEDQYKLIGINSSPGKAIKDLIKGKEYKKVS